MSVLFRGLHLSSPWDIVRFSQERANKEIGKMFHIWKNLHSYLVKFGGGKKGQLSVEDKWVLSKYNSTVKGFLTDLERYHLHHATRKVFTFIVEDFSRKYMKLAKERVRPIEPVQVGFGKSIGSQGP